MMGVGKPALYLAAGRSSGEECIITGRRESSLPLDAHPKPQKKSWEAVAGVRKLGRRRRFRAQPISSFPPSRQGVRLRPSSDAVDRVG